MGFIIFIVIAVIVFSKVIAPWLERRSQQKLDEARADLQREIAIDEQLAREKQQMEKDAHDIADFNVDELFKTYSLLCKAAKDKGCFVSNLTKRRYFILTAYYFNEMVSEFEEIHDKALEMMLNMVGSPSFQYLYEGMDLPAFGTELGNAFAAYEGVEGGWNAVADIELKHINENAFMSLSNAEIQQLTADQNDILLTYLRQVSDVMQVK